MISWGNIIFFYSVSHYNFTLLCWNWTAFVFEDFHFYGNFRQVDHDFTLEKPSHGINRTAAAIATDGSGKVENQDGPKVSSIIPSLPKDHQELWEFDMFSRLANRSQVRYTRYLEKLKGTTKPKSSQFSPHPHELPTFLLATIEVKRCKYWIWL